MLPDKKLIEYLKTVIIDTLNYDVTSTSKERQIRFEKYELLEFAEEYLNLNFTKALNELKIEQRDYKDFELENTAYYNGSFEYLVKCNSTKHDIKQVAEIVKRLENMGNACVKPTNDHLPVHLNRHVTRLDYELTYARLEDWDMLTDYVGVVNARYLLDQDMSERVYVKMAEYNSFVVEVLPRPIL